MAEVPAAAIWIVVAITLVAVTIALSTRGRATRKGRNGGDGAYPYGADAGGDCSGADGGGCGGGD